MPGPMLSGWIKSWRRWLSLNSSEKESPVPGRRVQKWYQYKKSSACSLMWKRAGLFGISAIRLMEGIHGIVMVVEAEPSSGHISGETGRRRRFKPEGCGTVRGSAFLQNLGGRFLHVFQQKGNELLLFILPCGISGQIGLFHRILLQVEQKHLVSAGGVYKLDLAAHHAEIRMKAVSVKYPILSKRVRIQQALACDVFRNRNAGHFQDGWVNICDLCRPVNGKVMGNSLPAGGTINSGIWAEPSKNRFFWDMW